VTKKFTHETRTTRMPATFCPKCFQLLDATTCMTGDAKPEPDDCTICIGCSSVLRFKADMSLEMFSLEQIPTHSRMRFAQMVQAIKERKTNGA
jgi:hypothetical protein